MKLRVLLFFLLCIFSLIEINAQTVQVCVTINGTPMPASKTWSMCRKNTVTSTSVSSVTLTATNCATTPESNVTITWKNLSVPPHTDSLDNIIIASDTGRWEVTILNNVTAMAYKDTLHLIYHPAIGITIINVPPYNGSIHGCPTDKYTINTTQVGALVGYQWYTYSPKTIIPGATGPTHNLIHRTKFHIIEARDANNCVASDTSNLSYPGGFTPANVNLGPDPSTIYCEGDVFNLVSLVDDGLSGNPSGLDWGIGNDTINDAADNTAGNAPTTDPAPAIPVTLQPGLNKIWLIVHHFPFCSNVDTINVIARPIPVVSLPAGPLDTCYASNVNLTATVSVGTGTFNYVWSSVPSSTLPTNNSTSTTNTITINPTINAIYTVTVTDSYNCSSGMDNITVNVNPEIITTASPDVTICLYPTDSTTLTASATGGTGAITYEWSPANGLANPSSGTTNAFPIITRTYTVTSTDAVGCTDTEDVTVTSYTPPVNAITEPQVINEDVSTTLDASINAALPTAGNNGASFEWTTSINNVPFSIASNIYLEFAGPDTVWYVIKVTNPTPVNGSGLQCYVTDTIEIRSISNNTLMYVPNVFSPNAQNPTNQTIKIYSTNILPDGFKWLIFNKWGNLVFETTNLEEAQSRGWDGGSMIEGVYSYVIVGTFKNGKDLKESEAYRGTFTLIK